MFAQKIKALALRNQTQARDVFDIYYLLKTNSGLHPNKQLAEYLEKAQENALSITFTDFKGQVLAYLTEEAQTNFNDKLVWENIVSMVIDSLGVK